MWQVYITVNSAQFTFFIPCSVYTRVYGRPGHQIEDGPVRTLMPCQPLIFLLGNDLSYSTQKEFSKMPKH